MGRVYKSIDMERLAAAVEAIFMLSKRLGPYANENTVHLYVTDNMAALDISGMNAARVGVATDGRLTLSYVVKEYYGDMPGVVGYDVVPIICDKLVVGQKGNELHTWCTADGLIDAMARLLGEFYA